MGNDYGVINCEFCGRVDCVWIDCCGVECSGIDGRGFGCTLLGYVRLVYVGTNYGSWVISVGYRS